MAQALIRRRKTNSFPYTVVDFVRFNGSSDGAFDTGVKQSLDNIITVTFDVMGNTDSGIFGMNQNSYHYRNKFCSGPDNDTYVGSSGSASKTFTGSLIGKHTYEYNVNGKATFDGTEVISSIVQGDQKNLYLGKAPKNNSTMLYMTGKIYEFNIKSISTGKDLINLVPVQYDDSGVTKYGFWDTVSRTLITNSTWTGGNDPPVEIVSWATGTPEKIAAMLQAHDDGLINIYDYWHIGDERTVSLSAISAGTALPAMAAQTVTMVLMNEGYNGQSGIHYVVGQKNCLSDDSALNTTKTNAGSWGSSELRTDLNSGYYNAFPASEKALYKPFNTVTISENDATTLQTVQDYFALPAEKEVQGAATYSVAEEAAALSQFEYYETAANRIKYKGSSARRWHNRSPRSGNAQFCQTYSDGAAWYTDSNASWGIAPFGCI